MRINLLREFIMLSKNLNFSKTAQQLYITQPVLSKHIALLEEKAGATLLTRRLHNVELTDIGKLFLEEAIAVVNQYDDGMRRVKMAVYGLEKELKLGYLYAHTRNILVPSVQVFEKHHTNVNLTLIACEYGELTEKLKCKDVDLIVTLNFDKDILQWCDTQVLYKDTLCVAVCSDHPLAKQKSINIKDLYSQRILMPSKKKFNGYAKFLKEILNSEKLSQNRVIRYECMKSSLLMVEAGDGIAIIPEKLKDSSMNLNFISFENGRYSFDVIAAWRRSDENPAIKSFIKTLSNI